MEKIEQDKFYAMINKYFHEWTDFNNSKA
jgi:hypothetical protein